MARYVYPAIFEREGTQYNVTFPDLPDCYTCGDDQNDALFMAQDVLADVLADKEECGEAIPTASMLADVSAPTNAFVAPITADTEAWRRAHSDKAIKKTLTIPQWLNTAAEARGINFSQTLQSALRTQLGL